MAITNDVNVDRYVCMWIACVYSCIGSHEDFRCKWFMWMWDCELHPDFVTCEMCVLVFFSKCVKLHPWKCARHESSDLITWTWFIRKYTILPYNDHFPTYINIRILTAAYTVYACMLELQSWARKHEWVKTSSSKSKFYGEFNI